MQNFILYLATVLIWGSTWFVITFQLGTVAPTLSVAYRFAIAAIALLLLCALTGRLKALNFTRKQHLIILAMGACLFSINYWIFYMATNYLTSGLVAVCFSTMVIMNALNQAWLFKTPISKQILLSATLGLTGMGFIFWPEIQNLSLEDDIVLGVALALLASYIASLGNMASLWTSREGLPVILTNTVGMAYGTIISFVLALFTGAELTFDTSFNYMWSLFYLAILGSAIAFWCYLTLLRNIGADKAAYATVLFPIVALIISTIFEGYVWTIEAFIGIGIVLGGNVIAMVTKRPLSSS